jgi:hypothetical protein
MAPNRGVRDAAIRQRQEFGQQLCRSSVWYVASKLREQISKFGSGTRPPEVPQWPFVRGFAAAAGAEDKSAAAYANHSKDRSELTRASIFDVFATPAVNAEGARRLEHLDLNCNHAGLNFSDDFFTILQ